MAEKIIECVPNFSEGRNKDVIKKITDAIESVEGITLLNVDPGFEMNRTVVTFIGKPESVKEAAFRGMKTASELIDMRTHKGAHPRMGATDVCPFIPVSGITTEECIALSCEVGERVGRELGIPVYLYEKSARTPQRENLAIIRQGEYEGFAEKMKHPEWKPDYGPDVFNAESGATVIGVREFLVAYNINLNTREVKYATDIAYELREKGRSAREYSATPFYNKRPDIMKYKDGDFPCGTCDYHGKTIQDTVTHCMNEHQYDLADLLILNGINAENPVGESVKKPGLFSNCKAIGWMVPEFGRAQISINLTNYKITSMHQVLEATRKLAEERGIVVTGSEIVGMVPFAALYETGKYYLAKQGRSTGVPWRDVLETAVQSLGLQDVNPFIIDERVLGLPKADDNALVSMKVSELLAEVSRESPAPGGGSIAALSGALGAALSSMVANLTLQKDLTQEAAEQLHSAANTCQALMDQLQAAVDDDTNAFAQYMSALKMAKNTPEEKAVRRTAMQNGLKQAVSVPLGTARASLQALEVAKVVVQLGNPASITDVGVGALTAFTGVKGGVYNVLINLKGIDDAAFNAEMREICEDLTAKAEEYLNFVATRVEERLKA